MPKFLTDENVAPSVVKVLKEAKFNVKTVQEIGLSQATDDQIIKRANKENRVIITHDKDFGNLLNYPLETHQGVVLLRFINQSPENIIGHLLPFLKSTGAKKIKGSLVILREGYVKIIKARK